MTREEKQSLEIAARLKAAREQAGLSQAQIAEMLKVHRPTISEIEAGRRKISGVEIARLAELYEVDADWLLGLDDSGDIGNEYYLAARELSRLQKPDFERLMGLLRSLRKDRQGQ